MPNKEICGFKESLCFGHIVKYFTVLVTLSSTQINTPKIKRLKHLNPPAKTKEEILSVQIFRPLIMKTR
jgi:hypothetical protein